jgi:septal ring-binding cell division protein DamX
VDSASAVEAGAEVAPEAPADLGEMPLPAYAVQIAAYRSPEQALTAVRTADVGGLLILRSQRERRTWHVVVLGLYATREAAAAAEASYLRTHPGAATWLRSTALLSAASVPEDDG